MPVYGIPLNEAPKEGVEGVLGSGSGNIVLNNKIKILFSMWNESGTLEMEKQAFFMIRKFGFEEVEIGFREAMMHKRPTLAYVRGVCTKRQEKMAIEKSCKEAAIKKKELDDIISADRKSGKKLNLVEMVYGSRETATGG